MSDSLSVGESIRYSWLRPSVHPSYARIFIAHLNNKGYDVNQLFKGCSITWQELLEARNFINFDQYRRLVLNAMRLTNCPWLSIEISSVIQVSAHGPLGYGALSAQTVGQAFTLASQMLATRLSLYEISMEHVEDAVQARLTEKMELAELREFVLVTLLGSFVDLLERTSGTSCSKMKVAFPYEEPPWSHLYRERFGDMEIEFDADEFMIELPWSMMDLHCLTSDDFAYRNAVRECEQLLANQGRGGELSLAIRNYLYEIEPPYPTQEEAAADRHMSVRTLIRKLKAENTSYQKILDEVRKELGCWHLQNSDLQIDQIAEKLGYKDTSNFSRVFKRWMQMTPSEFKQHSA